MTLKHETDSTFVAHEACPDCGSSDGLSRYSDGHAFCFAGCAEDAAWKPSDGAVKAAGEYVASIAKGKEWKPVRGAVQALGKRGLTEVTLGKWRYEVGTYNERPVQIANYIRDGVVIAQKLRFPDKSFTFLGKPKDAGLFGMHLWRDGGRKVVITEGEIDALTVSQLQDNKWPVVSVPNGANGAARDLAKHIDWLEQFDEVILMLDDDEPGRAATQDCAALFSPGKCKVARIGSGFKDANDAHVAGQGKLVIDAIWGAKVYRPDGIVTAADVVEEALAEPPEGYPWCFPSMNKLTFGRRDGELIAVGAGTGVGKTDFFTQQIEYDLNVLGLKVGLLYLEQPPRDTLRRVAGKAACKVFHAPSPEKGEPGYYTPEERESAIRAIGATDRLFLYNHFGACEWDVIRERIRYMVVALGCKTIYLDHLTALAAGAEDEKQVLDGIMAELAGLGQQLGCVIHFISHLATPEGKPHEEGGRVTIRQFRGSRAIGFWSHFMVGLERNQQAEDETERSTTTVRWLKDRVTGRATGKTLGLRYDSPTGRLIEADVPGEFRDETTKDF